MFTTKGRRYYDGDTQLPSVTQILEAYPKNLTKWAASTVAGYAVDHWDTLALMPPSVRLRRIESALWEARDTAAMRGTDIHRHGERLVAGEAVDVPDEHRGPVEAYARFLDTLDVQPQIVERPVLNRTYGYAGRPDLLATLGGNLRGQRALLDLKTGKNIYDSHVLQAVAYANATIWLDEDNLEQLWTPPEACYAVHILPDDVRLIPLAADEQAFDTFLNVLEVHHYLTETKQAWSERRAWPVGQAIHTFPTAQTTLDVADGAA
jgi:hypothetical protein